MRSFLPTMMDLSDVWGREIPVRTRRIGWHCFVPAAVLGQTPSPQQIEGAHLTNTTLVSRLPKASLHASRIAQEASCTLNLMQHVVCIVEHIEGGTNAGKS